MDICLDIVIDADGRRPILLKIAALNALHNIFSNRPGRLDFLNTDSVMEQGEFRQAAMEAYLKTKLRIFNRYLSTIPNETIMVYEKGQDTPTPVTRPLPSSIELVESVLKVKYQPNAVCQL